MDEKVDLDAMQERYKRIKYMPSWTQYEIEGTLLQYLQAQKSSEGHWCTGGTLPASTFIAHARQDIPTLIELVNRQAETIREAEAVLNAAKEYFDQRADIHHDNPHAPNEEMRLWEEINTALVHLNGEKGE